MNRPVDPFIALATADVADDFVAPERRPIAASQARSNIPPMTPAVGKLQGFNLLDQPVIGNLAGCTGQLVAARSTVALSCASIGRDVVVLFENGDPELPIIIGVIEPDALEEASRGGGREIKFLIDDERHVIEAKREIIIRCGDASITLTRAGKVIITGNYILSRSTGYTKVKGAAIDIN